MKPRAHLLVSLGCDINAPWLESYRRMIGVSELGMLCPNTIEELGRRAISEVHQVTTEDQDNDLAESSQWANPTSDRQYDL